MSNEELRRNDVMIDNIISSKYLQPGESIDEMFTRISKAFHKLEKENSDGFDYETIDRNLRHFKYIVPGGSVIASIGTNDLTSLSNCFVIGGEYSEDSFNSMTVLEGQMKNIYKRRGGVGHDLSYLRPKGSKVNNSARWSTGAVSFAESFSNLTGTVGQNGRRGALMLSLSIEHPDAQEFIEVKKNPDKINNANLSLRITDRFMKAVKDNAYFIQRFPLNLEIQNEQSILDADNVSKMEGKLMPYKDGYIKIVQAAKLFRLLTDSAWQSAEPGCLFWDTIVKESNGDAYDEFKTESTNPCFSHDTLVMTTSGPRKIGELADEGKDIEVYAYDIDTKKIVTKLAKNIRKTGNKKVIRLTFYNAGNFRVICTGNHKFLLANNEYREAEKLVSGDKIKTAYFYTSNPIIGTSLTVKRIEKDEDPIDVYDMEVEDVHNFIVAQTKTKCSTGLVVHNCGEIPLSPYDSCRLIALNLSNFVENPWTKSASVDWDQLLSSSKIITHLADDIVTEEINHLNRIIDKVAQSHSRLDGQEIELYEHLRDAGKMSRRCGIGILGLADMLAKLGYRYSSPEANEFCEKLMKFITVNVYKTSFDLAESRGVFPKFDDRKSSDFLFRLYEATHTLNKVTRDTVIYHTPRRNLSLMTIAPTGTISLISGASSGMEPVINTYYRRKVKNSETGEWNYYTSVHPGFIEWYSYFRNISYDDAAKDLQSLNPDMLDKLTSISPYHKSISHEIDYKGKLDLQSRLQKWIDHSISVTMNLPSETTKEEVFNLYMTAYELKCKGLTIYRDGSRDPVISFKSKSKIPVRPVELHAKVYRFKVRDSMWNAVIGLNENDQPYELFVWDTKKYVEIPPEVTYGSVTRRKSETDEHAHYDFSYLDDNEFRTTIPNINDVVEREQGVVTKLVSGFLRNNIPVSEVIHSLEKLKWNDENMKIWSRGICRSLKEYIKDGESGYEKCPVCGAELVYQSGCKYCPNCGHSHCNL